MAWAARAGGEVGGETCFHPRPDVAAPADPVTPALAVIAARTTAATVRGDKRTRRGMGTKRLRTSWPAGPRDGRSGPTAPGRARVGPRRPGWAGPRSGRSCTRWTT